MGDFDFSDAEKDFEDAKPATRENLPDGKYAAVIDRAQLAKSKTKNQPMLKITLKVAEGEYTGRLVWMNFMLVTKENFAWLKKDMETLKLTDKIKKLSELEANLGAFLDLKVEITVKSRGENQNVYINKLLGTLDAASIAPPPQQEQKGTGPAGDDLPF